MRTVLLLLISNVFMVFAWYGHLRFKSAPLATVILASWGIAFFEYCFMVPANRFGHGQFSTIQLKVIQEVLTLLVFGVFVITYMGEALRWNHLASFTCLVAAVYFVFGFGPAGAVSPPPEPAVAIAAPRDDPGRNDPARDGHAVSVTTGLQTEPPASAD
ncbi:MAG: hypothetical protein EA381_01665 [Planctomycetaceae bacterium]|nr:MAG: hypothetical protein EA381_01665 [Planctomycetaceae bacterium]